MILLLIFLSALTAFILYKTVTPLTVIFIVILFYLIIYKLASKKEKTQEDSFIKTFAIGI